MLNKAMIIGRLGQAPKCTTTQGGVAVCQLSIATDESYTDRDGNKVERTEWHRAVAYRKTAEICEKYLAKGSLVYVEGKLATRKWQDKDGTDRYSTEIQVERVQFLDRKESGHNEQPQQPTPQQAMQQRQAYDPLAPMDDVPF